MFDTHEKENKKWTINSYEWLSRWSRYDHKTTLESFCCLLYVYISFLFVRMFQRTKHEKSKYALHMHTCTPPHLIRNIPCHGPVPVTFEVSVFVDFLLLLLFYRQSLLDALFCVIQHHSKPSPRILIVTSITEHFLM